MFVNKKIRRSLIMTLGPWHDKPWWWRHLNFNHLMCDIKYERITIGNKKGKELNLVHAIILSIKTLLKLLRYKVDFVFTFECDWTSFIISFMQSFGFIKTPKHIILQFIMREKENSLKSLIKYQFMRFCFSSVYMVICSSKSERTYYQEVFGWNQFKIRYIPFHTDPRLLAFDSKKGGDFIISVGRTFRDYQTLFSAVKGLNIMVIAVASPDNMNRSSIPKNVVIKYDIPINDVIDLIKESMIVVLPLENRKISIGQSVLLQAKAMGKAIVVTKTNGTEDYIENMVDGIFVEAKNEKALEKAIVTLLNDEKLREKLGKNAKKSVKDKYLPQHYLNNVCRIIDKCS